MMIPNYRHLARNALERAGRELNTEDLDRLNYAALELRLSLEYVTYDRVYAYREEIPPTEYHTWQPTKLMRVLLEIDPWADKSVSIAVAVEESYGVVAPGTELKSLGMDHVVDMATLQKHYDALGSYLHAPTIKQLENPKANKEEKLRKRCNEIIKVLEKSLSSPVFNMTVGGFSEIKCMRCEQPIRRRMPIEKKEIEANCFNCDAAYLVIIGPDRSTTWKPKQRSLYCSNRECEKEILLWEDEIQPGTYWKCDSCNKESQIFLGVRTKNTVTS